jgi:hypothetical protein
MKVREIEKGVILPDAFEANGLDILLETIAADYCCNNYSGTSADDIRIYSEMVLQHALSQDERQKLLISLVQFDKLDSNALRGAQFGGIEHFEYIYAGPRLIDERDVMKIWMAERTGLVEMHADPCDTALQLRGIFKKFVHDDGVGRRDQLPLHALSRGTIYKGAPTPNDCVSACIKAGFIDAPNFRNYVRRVAGEPYDEVVEFIKNWALKPRLQTMLDEICPIKGCPHVPPFSKK